MKTVLHSGKWPSDFKCPDCGEGSRPARDRDCVLGKPLALYIPPGEHTHIHCPVHGDHKIYGGPGVHC